jgi:hypothetical protein
MDSNKPPQHVIDVCKIGKGAQCCRYLAVGQQGFICLKFTSNKSYLDARVAANSMRAHGDNCEGQKGVIQ